MRHLGLISCLLPALMAIPARADLQPLTVVRIESIDGLLAQTKAFLATARTLSPELGKQFDPIAESLEEKIATTLGADWDKAIDRKRPFLLFAAAEPAAMKALSEIDDPADLAKLKPGDVALGILVPVKDSAQFTKLVQGFVPLPEADADGTYTFPEEIEAGMKPCARFLPNWLYLTIDKRFLVSAEKLPLAAMELRGEKGFLSIWSNLKAAPKDVRQTEAQLLRDTVTMVKTELPEEAKNFSSLIDRLVEPILELITDADEVTLRFGYEVARNEFYIELESLPGKGTPFEKRLANLKPLPSRMSGVCSPNALASFRYLGEISAETVRDGLEAIQKSAKERLNEVPAELRPSAEKALDILRKIQGPQALEIAVALHPSGEGKYVVLAGMALPQAKEWGELLRDLKDAVPDSIGAVKFDVAKVNGFSVHEIIVKEEASEATKKVLGSSRVLIAFGNEAAWLSVGGTGPDDLKRALDAQPQPGPGLALNVHPKRMLPMLRTIGVAEKELENRPGLAKIGNLSVVRAETTIDSVMRWRLSMSGWVMMGGFMVAGGAVAP